MHSDSGVRKVTSGEQDGQRMNKRNEDETRSVI